MTDPVRIRVRCAEETREEWTDVKGTHDLTHGELARAAATFIKENEEEFKAHLGTVPRKDDSKPRT